MFAQNRRSKGCLSCRSKKVKCDESKPTCSRCSRTHRQCKYPNSLETDFRNETEKASLRAKAQWRQRVGKSQPRPGSKEIVHFSSASSTSDDTSLVSSLELQNTINVNFLLKYKALAAFYHDFSCFDKNAGPWLSFFQLIPGLYADHSPESPLSLGVSALAYANLAKKHHEQSSEIIARSEYCKTLRTVNQALQAPSIVENEDVFVTVALLLLYEALTSPRCQNHHFNSIQHLQGAIIMLKLRGSRPFQSKAGQLAGDVIEVQMILGSLLLRQKPPIPLEFWSAKPSRNMPGVRLIRLMYQVAEAGAAVDGVAKTSIDMELSKDTMQDLISQLEALDSSLVEWENSLPETWHYYSRTTMGRSDTTASSPLNIMEWPGAPTTEYTFATNHFIFPHCIYFGTRVIVNQHLVTALTWMIQNYYLSHEEDLLLMQAAQRRQEREVLTAVLTETICGSVGSLLGCSTEKPPEPLTPSSMAQSPLWTMISDETDPIEWAPGVRALFCLWPLRIAVEAVKSDEVSAMVGPGIREWLTLVLSLVYRMNGIPQGQRECPLAS